jgi:glycosyltransferase involved in cell wall biosynthesis
MPMNIAFVIETSGGGSGRHLLDLAAGLIQRGHSVHVIYSTVRAEARFESELKAIPGIKVASVPMQRSPHPSDFSASAAIAAYLRKHGPFDIVHGQSSKGGALARLSVRDRSTARIYTPHCFRTLDPELGRVGHLIYGSAEWVLGFLGDAIICVSPEELDHAVSRGFSREGLHMVFNGVKPLDLSQRSQIRSQLGIPDSEVCIGFLGRYVPQKAPERMIDLAASLAATTLPPWRVAMIGEGSLEESLRLRAKESGVLDKIAWGPGAMGPRAMSAFDIFAMPSAYEGMPYVLIEAAAAGLPIVASDVGGVRAVIAQGENGAIIRNWDPKEFAAQIARLVADTPLRQKMSAASRQKARAFTIDTMIDQTLAVYERALSARRSPDARKAREPNAVAAGKNGL